MPRSWSAREQAAPRALGPAIQAAAPRATTIVPGAHAADAGENGRPSACRMGIHRPRPGRPPPDGRGDAGSGRGTEERSQEGIRIVGKTEVPDTGLEALFPSGRGDWIRTSDLLRPSALPSCSHAPMAKRQCSTAGQRRCRPNQTALTCSRGRPSVSLSCLTERCVRSPETGTVLTIRVASEQPRCANTRIPPGPTTRFESLLLWNGIRAVVRRQQEVTLDGRNVA